MRIYRVRVDVNAFQSLFLENREEWCLDDVTCDCSPRAGDWTTPQVYVLKPKLNKGNFSALNDCVGTLVVDAVALEELRDLLQQTRNA